MRRNTDAIDNTFYKRLLKRTSKQKVSKHEVPPLKKQDSGKVVVRVKL